MGKTVVVGIFLVTFFVAVVIFLTSSNKSAKDQLTGEDSRTPRIILDDFSFYRYRGAKLKSTFSAKLGHFLEPNIIEVYASIRGVRYKQDQVETLRCEAGSALLDAESMNALFRMKDVKLLKGEIEERVRLGIGDNVMRTDYAQFREKDNLVFSREPVEVDGPNRKFFGDKGFRYTLDKEDLEMEGNVHGEFEPVESEEDL